MMVVCDAIRSHLQLRFSYEGLPRIVEPYLHGVTTAGRPALRAYQIGGSSRHAGAGWRLFGLAKTSGLALLDEPFAIRPEYRSHDRAFRVIHCQVV